MQRILFAVLIAFGALAAVAAPIPKEAEKLLPPTEKQLDASRNNLKQIGIAIHGYNDTNGKMPADIQSIIMAWLSGDADALDRISLKSFRDTPRSGKWVQQKLITERNLSMARTIEQRLAQGHIPFVAVGAMHLVGKDGLPELFKKKGYRVVNLYKGSSQASK